MICIGCGLNLQTSAGRGIEVLCQDGLQVTRFVARRSGTEFVWWGHSKNKIHEQTHKKPMSKPMEDLWKTRGLQAIFRCFPMRLASAYLNPCWAKRCQQSPRSTAGFWRPRARCAPACQPPVLSLPLWLVWRFNENEASTHLFWPQESNMLIHRTEAFQKLKLSSAFKKPAEPLTFEGGKPPSWISSILVVGQSVVQTSLLMPRILRVSLAKNVYPLVI